MSDKHDFMPLDRSAFPPAAAPAPPASDERPTVRAGMVDGITVVEILDAETLFTEEAIADLTAQLRRLVEAGQVLSSSPDGETTRAPCREGCRSRR